MPPPSTPSSLQTPVKGGNGLLSAYTPTAAGRPSLAPLTPSAHHQHQQSMHETLTVMNELIHEFRNNADEVAAIQRLLVAKSSIRSELQAKQQAMKSLIEGLTNEAAHLESLTAQPASIGLQQQQQLLLSQKSSYAAQIASLTQEIERLEARGVEMDAARAALQAQKVASEAAARKRMPAMAGTMGLYRNFSSIAWDYDCDEKNMVKGTFHFDAKPTTATASSAVAAAPAAATTKPATAASIKSFQFSRKEMSDFDIANQLWEMMETQ